MNKMGTGLKWSYMISCVEIGTSQVLRTLHTGSYRLHATKSQINRGFALRKCTGTMFQSKIIDVIIQIQ